ncbi:hypothetical protein PMZ80_005688 [Knufia obscura]|uniref:Uncharacterized protein n=1 Tax=Knufia obscura TaxID=1635080 RepID=A0ABR0RMX4_9EURO|nr:hypothetical protein PMZ80_005688 [Knufia obscura]
MGIRDASGKERAVLITNTVIRLAQCIVAAAGLAIYATQRQFWGDLAVLYYLLALASVAVTTAALDGHIPLFFSYRPVALSAPWDLLLLFLYGGAFGWVKVDFSEENQKNISNYLEMLKADERYHDVAQAAYNIFVEHWNTMSHSTYINLVQLILFLISGTMGVVVFSTGWRNIVGGRTRKCCA